MSSQFSLGGGGWVDDDDDDDDDVEACGSFLLLGWS